MKELPIKVTVTKEIIIPADKIEYLQRELTNVRTEFIGNKYVNEAITVLAAGGLRSAIGAYWNAVVDDLRRKIMHRSLDLFNKQVSPKREIKSYEDFQNYVTDYDLIEGAYKIGVIGWEALKMLQQARETRNIYDGHPDSSDPTLFKVFNMMADCNRYVLSQEYPPMIIDVNEYILTMDSDTFNKNELAIEQAFVDLPDIYKSEMVNRLFTLYIGENASTRLRGNIELGFPILWRVLPKEMRQQIGQRFDKLMVEGNRPPIEKGINILTLVDGFRYISAATRKIIYDPAIKELEENLDNWGVEGRVVQYLERLGSTIPSDLIPRYVSALTLTFVGYRGSSYSFNRTAFYSNVAAPRISALFENFDNASADAFIQTIKANDILRGRIGGSGQLTRLRALGQILLNKQEIREDTKRFLELLVDANRTNEFFSAIASR